LSAFTWPPERPAAADATTVEQRAEPAVEQVPAAVLVPLFLTDTTGTMEPHVVLTRRRADLRRHAGEISFPGGRRDPEDATLTDTALREAEEEIGLARAHVSLLGELPPTSTFVTNYVIHPFVATIPAGVEWRPSAREVDAVLELPLSAIRAGRTTTKLERRGISFETDAFVIDEHVVWGATARILEHLLERLRTTDPDGGLTLAWPASVSQEHPGTRDGDTAD
jgi:8-oxo-dGTP pyrophosphatase MutT (NUDIX family)